MISIMKLLNGLCFLILFAVTNYAATLTVSNADDSGEGSLRQAILESNVNGQNDEINFDPMAFALPQTIFLTSGLLEIDPDNAGGDVHSVRINGPGADLITINANNQSRVFAILGGSIATLVGMTITGGNGTGASVYNNAGGGILVFGGGSEGTYNLSLRECVVTGNHTGEGGGLLIAGTAEILNSAVVNNSSSVSGGGVLIGFSSTAQITNSTISENSAGRSGGGVYNDAGRLFLTNSTLAFNFTTDADGYGGGISSIVHGGNDNLFYPRNSIIANNTSATWANVYGPVQSRGYNIFGNFVSVLGDPAGNQFVNPHLDPNLALNGGVIPSHLPLADRRCDRSGYRLRFEFDRNRRLRDECRDQGPARCGTSSGRRWE